MYLGIHAQSVHANFSLTNCLRRNKDVMSEIPATDSIAPNSTDLILCFS